LLSSYFILLLPEHPAYKVYDCSRIVWLDMVQQVRCTMNKSRTIEGVVSNTSKRAYFRTCIHAEGRSPQFFADTYNLHRTILPVFLEPESFSSGFGRYFYLPSYTILFSCTRLSYGSIKIDT
jgi:hypothetical protein